MYVEIFLFWLWILLIFVFYFWFLCIFGCCLVIEVVLCSVVMVLLVDWWVLIFDSEGFDSKFVIVYVLKNYEVKIV